MINVGKDGTFTLGALPNLIEGTFTSDFRFRRFVEGVALGILFHFNLEELFELSQCVTTIDAEKHLGEVNAMALENPPILSRYVSFEDQLVIGISSFPMHSLSLLSEIWIYFFFAIFNKVLLLILTLLKVEPIVSDVILIHAFRVRCFSTELHQ